ncbi:MAG: hypothetical protein PWP27_761 [Clostridiales bacterium]|jgi:MerR family transcriptional regulator/heat shock protein HspR|nr:hypothetical protein [Clostridiales bacterium]MDK2932951.1 hypothetical protein [Clostridiales bacterium]
MIDENKGIYSIGTVASFIAEHPEILRVWERNNLIRPGRINGRRYYSNNDLLRLKFIKYLIDAKGLNIAGVKAIIDMYPCWFKGDCKGGALENRGIPINPVKPCWKLQDTFCIISYDISEECIVINNDIKDQDHTNGYM